MSPTALPSMARTVDPGRRRTALRRPTSPPARMRRATSSARARRASQTTTARRGCSTARRTSTSRAHIASSFVFELSKVGLLEVPRRMVANLRNVDEDLARRVADGLGIELPTKAKAAREPVDMASSDALSIHKNMKATLEGRAVGILIADGTDAGQLDAVVAAVTRAKGKAVIIAPKIGGATLSDGNVRKADGQLAGSPSQ